MNSPSGVNVSCCTSSGPRSTTNPWNHLRRRSSAGSRSWPELTTGTPRCQELVPESWSGSSKTKASLWEESWSAASWVKWAFRRSTPRQIFQNGTFKRQLCRIYSETRMFFFQIRSGPSTLLTSKCSTAICT